MATYYWNATTGNDSNNGSVGAPFLTFTGVNPAATLAALATGDTVNLTGIFAPSTASSAAFNAFAGPTITSKTSITITGSTPTLGTNGVSHAASVGLIWAPGGGTVWSSTLGAGYLIANIAVNYGPNATDMLGAPVYTGLLRSVASALLVVSTVESWFYDIATGLITINSSLNPNGTSVLVALLTDTSAITMVSCDNCVVKDVITRLTGFGSSSGGYGVIGQGSTFSTVQNVRAEYGAYHSIGFVGNINRGNTISSCVLSGSGSAISTQTVMFSGANTNVIDAVVKDSYFQLYPPVDTLGVVHASYTGIGGTYCHTTPDAAGSPRVESYDVNSCIFAGFTDSAGTVNRGEAMSGADPLSKPIADTDAEFVFSNYNIRHSDCRVYGLRWGGGVSGSAVNNPPANYPGALAARRVYTYINGFSNPYQTGVPLIGWSSTPAAGGNPKAGTMLLESCDFNWGFSSSGNFPILFGATTDNSGKRVVMQNCTVIDRTNRDGSIMAYAASAAAATADVNKYMVRGFLYYRVATPTRNLFAGNTSETNATLLTSNVLDIHNCWYYQSGGTFRYVNNTVASPNYVLESDYQSDIDTTGVYGVLPAFVSATTNGEPTAGSNIRTTLNAVLIPTPGNGINGQRYSRLYGAYQFGGSGGGSRIRGGISTRNRLLMDVR